MKRWERGVVYFRRHVDANSQAKQPVLKTPGICLRRRASLRKLRPQRAAFAALLGPPSERRKGLSLGNGLCRSPSESSMSRFALKPIVVKVGRRHWSVLGRQASPSFWGGGAASDAEGLDAGVPCRGD